MSKLKMFCVLPRRADISPQEFHDHWRHPHATLARQVASVRGYVQSHQISTPLLASDQTRYEGVVEVWFDSPSDAALFPKDPAYVRDMIPDEPLFIDMAGIRYVFTEEDVLMSSAASFEGFDAPDRAWREANSATSIKIIQLSSADFAGKSSADEDAALGRRVGALRHVLCRPSRVLHAGGASFSAVRELWWPTESAFMAGVQREPQAWNALMKREEGATTLMVRAERVV